MAFFDSFTSALKQKWLEFYQVNRPWLGLHMQNASVETPDGGRRPPSYFIIGALNGLEPKLAQLMLPFSQLNPDADTLIQVLGLDFDPDMQLDASPNAPIPTPEPSPIVDRFAAISDPSPVQEAEPFVSPALVMAGAMGIATTTDAPVDAGAFEDFDVEEEVDLGDDLDAGLETEDDEFGDLGTEDDELGDLGTEDDEFGDLGTEDDEFAGLGTEDDEFAGLGTEDDELAGLGTEDDEFGDLGTEDDEFGDLGTEDDELAGLGTE
ncbi:MAG: DUF5331 domain-containing protein, partial [Geitlerinemataceae cyanobacterium]